MSFFEAMFGDDFPDAFANRDGRSCKSKKTFLDLPTELLEIVCQTLSKMDIKRLRLASREVAEKVELRIDRVYISPNRANLDCLNNILNDPRYHLRVQEIVWDDAQLDEYPTLEDFANALDRDSREARIALEDHLQSLMRPEGDSDANYMLTAQDHCIQEDGQLTDLGKTILLRSDDPISRDMIARNAMTTSIVECYALYQRLYQDEKEIMKRRWDVGALERALAQLPNLRRITLTSEVWRPWKTVPTYDTPFFRALPAGFRKPSVATWSGGSDRTHTHLARAVRRQHLPEATTNQMEDFPSYWRGYGIIMASLVAIPTPHLEEFAVDVGNEWLGVPQHIFALPNLDYNNTLRALGTTQLKDLQLSMSPADAWPDHLTERSFVDFDLIKNLLVALPHLEKLDLALNSYSVERSSFYGEFPEHTYHTLKHIALRKTNVYGSWLFDFVKRSKNLKTIALDKLLVQFGHSPECDRDRLFTELREYFHRTPHQRPRFTWVDCPSHQYQDDNLSNRKRWEVLDDELDAYLYDGGESPWWVHNLDSFLYEEGEQPLPQGSAFKPGFGWIMDDRDSTFRKKR